MSNDSLPSLPATESVAEAELIAEKELAAPVVEHQSAEPEGIWAAIREALRGSHRDYTVGPIGRSVILLAIPMVLEMVMESVFAVVDIFWVAHLGTDAAE